MNLKRIKTARSKLIKNGQNLLSESHSRSKLPILSQVKKRIDREVIAKTTQVSPSRKGPERIAFKTTPELPDILGAVNMGLSKTKRVGMRML